MAHRILGYLLPSVVDARLRRHCKLTGDDPVDVLADLVELHLDALDGDVIAPAPPRDQFELPLGTRAS